jgi:hypothetical protein
MTKKSLNIGQGDLTMLSFIKKLFGSTPAETPAPYKVEAPKAEVTPAAKTSKPKAEKAPAAKKTTTRKPRAPKA